MVDNNTFTPPTINHKVEIFDNGGYKGAEISVDGYRLKCVKSYEARRVVGNFFEVTFTIYADDVHITLMPDPEIEEIKKRLNKTKQK